ncbi:MAG: NAD(P)/FAD-dependent oxidoreductase [Deltaproteobacteria bacterium]|nr:NAD(P)/FAD-dependent oxidoreductase [Deltaproteobacteria bacterium]MBW1794320.1 NAD(P)/FAD-dependent oxidoreductase [Deltaproteobacteria bacterium]MBW2330885.1 NAD(P)/FAD-dependent oxidoreductase [Deltaproteobacteria bacterium]
MTDRPKGAIIQRDKKTYAVVPRTPMGLVTPDVLENIANVVRKYEIPVIKITSAQRMVLVGMSPEVVDEVWRDLGMDMGPAVELCVHYVQACPGNTLCKLGVQDSLGLGGKLEELFVGMHLPAKAKIGISGCPMNCGESYMRDFGAFGKKSGWTVIFGGNAGRKPRIGDVIAENLNEEEVIDLAKRCFEYYAANGKKKERTARFIERIGIEEFKKAVR